MKTPRRALYALFFLIVVSLSTPTVADAQEDGPLPRGPVSPSSSSNGSITGKVVLPSGQPVDGRVRIILSTMTDPGNVAYTDSSGGFGFRGLREGNYTIEVTGDTRFYETVTQEVRLIRGMQVRLLINLKEKGSASNKSTGNVVSVAELDQNVPAAAKKEFDAGTRLAGEGKTRDAIERFKRALELHPGYLMAHNDLGAQYLKLKLYPQAIEQFEAALELNSKVFNPRLNLGIALVEQNKFTDALEHLKQATAIDKSAPAPHLYLGIASVETDELPAAERELGVALSLGGDEYAVAHYYLAQLHLKNGERDGAVHELKAYLQLVPTGEYASRAKKLLQQLKES